MALQALTGIKLRVNTLTAVTNTYTPNCNSTDMAIISAPAAAYMVAAPTGTPVEGQRLMIRIKNGATLYTPTWNAIYLASGVTVLPSAAAPLVINKTHLLTFQYDAVAAKWILLACDLAGY